MRNLPSSASLTYFSAKTCQTQQVFRRNSAIWLKRHLRRIHLLLPKEDADLDDSGAILRSTSKSTSKDSPKTKVFWECLHISVSLVGNGAHAVEILVVWVFLGWSFEVGVHLIPSSSSFIIQNHCCSELRLRRVSRAAIPPLIYASIFA